MIIRLLSIGLANSLLAAIYPGQALLLANVMDIFSAPNMVERGNFIALMYFVMALGCIIVYFGLGWATNIIAQVRHHLPGTWPSH